MKVRADRQRETRQRIAEAAAELHGEVGPARTTVAEIARRAGVQRLTVYNHFPDDAALFPACSAHYLSLHPFPDPTPAFAPIRDHIAVHAGPMDGCFVAGERVRPQPGGFYGGWITADLIGPFKGEPGTSGW